LCQQESSPKQLITGSTTRLQHFAKRMIAKKLFFLSNHIDHNYFFGKLHITMGHDFANN
jgi:hypothetical protein